MEPIGLLIVAAGLFSLLGAVFDWEWFMNSYKARFFVAILTRGGARILYGLLGVGIMVLGFMITFGLVEMSR